MSMISYHFSICDYVLFPVELVGSHMIGDLNREQASAV